MENKTCGECRHFRDADFKNMCFWKDQHREACADFESPTNGDVIRQGGDAALIDFADGIRRRMCHYCAFFQEKSCVDKTCGCWEGVKLWLNAPADCVKQNAGNDTQTDLCKADNTESEGEDGLY